MNFLTLRYGSKTLNRLSEYNTELKLKGFNAYKVGAPTHKPKLYSRKDFYKICMNTGVNRIHYADRTYETNGTVLFFGNPHIPYSWQTLSKEYTGYACLFSEEFIKQGNRSEVLQQSPFFKIGGTPILIISDEQRDYIGSIFDKMIAEQATDYAYKDDLIRNYMQLIVHEAMKMQPSENYTAQHDANTRVTTIFLELLERQFPIEDAGKPLALRSPQDYANNLSMHVNYLNRAVKTVTGKTTSAHISDRVITEAKALLQHTDWNVSHIAYALGFEYPSYFNNYFKKHTQQNPMQYRNV